MGRGNKLLIDVLEVIADEEDVRTVDLPPLGEVIDTDALATLLDEECGLVVSFEYEGYHVHMDSEGEFSIEGK